MAGLDEGGVDRMGVLRWGGADDVGAVLGV